GKQLNQAIAVKQQAQAASNSLLGATNNGMISAGLPGGFGTSGWYGWYLGSGLNLVYWSRLDDGRCLCVEIDRMRMLADLIAQLPDTAPQSDRLPNGRITLRDSNNALLYQWGAYDFRENEKPLTSLALTAPLQSWRLDYYAPASLYEDSGSGLLFSYLTGLGAIALALIVLAFYFYRESTRDMRLASQRVSFVNQVSHELKTPLTNVRLYAELLQQHLDGEDETAQRHLGIVVEECGRLSRLIGNVLTFGRSQRGTLTIRPAPGRVDEIIQRVLDGYRPTLERRGIKVKYEAGPAETVMVASDVVEQILLNLLSNIEKYAAGGGLAEITSAQQDGTTTITVADNGPGIPACEHEKIFKPFYRMSSALNDGAAGTGIGLAIARELARGHGGDLRVVDSDKGTAFEVTLETPESEQGL
ncbi:HAMP domain-containing histidine kinase, partial [bacterium]|nr:HAMP domain-containing histidine kinase [bacterium]